MQLSSGKRQHLWMLRPSGVPHEVLIVSASNGLVLDATRDDHQPVMWEGHGASWQRWRLEETPDGIGCLIRDVARGHYLMVNKNAVPGWEPWFKDRDPCHEGQEWIVAQPFKPLVRKA